MNATKRLQVIARAVVLLSVVISAGAMGFGTSKHAVAHPTCNVNTHSHNTGFPFYDSARWEFDYQVIYSNGYSTRYWTYSLASELYLFDHNGGSVYCWGW